MKEGKMVNKGNGEKADAVLVTVFFVLSFDPFRFLFSCLLNVTGEL